MALYESHSENDTARIARELADAAQPGDVFLLSGPLGAGKSAFARFFIRKLTGEDMEVPSPTFTLVQTYDSAKGSLWHFDLYRLQEPDEVYEIGWDEAMSGGICLIEWAERAGRLIPPYARTITITIVGDSERTISIDEPKA